MSRFSEKKAGIICASDLKTAKGKTVYWIMIGVLTINCIMALFPFIWVLLTGFKETKEIYSGFNFFPKEMSWDIFITKVSGAMKYMKFGRTALNTLIVSIGDAFFAVVVSGLAGYVISRLKPKGYQLVFMLIVWTMMMPGQIRTVPLFISYLSFPFVAEVPGEVSLLDTYWPIWLGAAANCFNIILFKNAFDAVSSSLVEAAKIDGCTNGKIFAKIMLPLSVPIIIYVAITSVKGSWSAFMPGYLIFQSESVRTLPVQVYMLQNDSSVQMNTYMLCLALSALPMLIIYALFNKHIIGGVNIGGVKG